MTWTKPTNVVPTRAIRTDPPLGLPPYSLGRARCVKCGQVGDATTTYDAEYEGPRAVRERLTRTCGRCGYEWEEAVVDAPTVLPSASTQGVHVGLMRDAQREHVFADASTCACGYGPTTEEDWHRHHVEVAYRALVDAGVIRC